jgi:monoamine oxidase
MESAMRKFVNVDGKFGRILIPFPHDPHYNPDVAKYDKMSFADRLAQIADDLTPNERSTFEGFLAITSGGTMENSSFFELIRWWALNNYDMAQFMELCLTFKFRHGQSSFARKFFDEALSTKRLSYNFNSPIHSVTDTGNHVRVVAKDGRKFQAKRVICTVPLNVLHRLTFNPPLLQAKQEASVMGHANHVVKVHVEVDNKELRSFSGITYPHNKLTYAFGDGTTPSGNTHIVSFGSSLPGIHLQPEENIEETIAAFKEFTPMNVKRVVAHNWHKDEFSEGAWEFLKPGMATNYLDVLRERQGNVIFASADWALGWRGFIDGGIEDGARAAKEVKDELAAERTDGPRL